MNPAVLPPIDPLPLPAPVWIFRVLHLVTFLLHLLAMNLLLGVGIVTAITAARGRRNAPHCRRLAEKLHPMLPVLTAATVTLGVAALLFLQVLFGRFFYTSSILLAVPWFSIVFLLIAAYYGHYFSAMSDTVRRERRAWIAWGSAILILIVGFIYTNNLTLLQTPERFRDLYLAGRSGVRLNFGEPTLIPRFLHFLTAAIAAAGLGIVAVGWNTIRRGEENEGFGAWTVRYGRKWFLGATAVQLVIGLWFLFSIPEQVRGLFLGGDPVRTGHLFVAVFLALAAVALLAAKPESGRIVLASAGLLALAILGMVLVRSWVRDAMLGPSAGLGELTVQPQWEVLAIFLVLFLGALATLGWMIRRFLKEGKRVSRREPGRLNLVS
ncbi:MAG: hypothetical protein ACE15D_18375 [Candidatus Eisenbacteria bacterium]|nr:hypothetical protein [Candidatus Eisenbacteria bacterium]